MVKVSQINFLNVLRSELPADRKAIGDVALNLYKDRKIEQYRTIEKILIDLKRKNNVKAIQKVNELMKSVKPTRQEQIKEELKKYEKKYLYTIRGRVDVETKYVKDKCVARQSS